MKKILVTGANGYVGKHVVEQLSKTDNKIIVAVRKDHGYFKQKNITIIEKDFLSEELRNPYEYFQEPDVCIHLAWKDGFIHNSDAHMLNLSNHYRFLTNMISGGLKQLAVLGTMHEIGYHEGSITEDTLCKPIMMYGVSKNALRESMMIFAKEKDVILQWLRAYYIYGDDLNNHSIFTKILQAEQRGDKTFPFNSGKNKYDFIHVEKLAEQIVRASLQTEINGIINCCSGKPVSLSEQVERFIKDNSLKIKLKYGEFPDREYDSPAVWGDDSKLRNILKEVQ